MHDSSMKQMETFIARHLAGKTGLKVLDVGALNVNGTYRGLFKDHDYTGMDIVAGPNVDVVGWEGVKVRGFDVVVSGQCAEHAESVMHLMSDIKASTKPGALICMIVPSRAQVEHRKPDYWRFTKEGAAKLIDYAGAELISVEEAGRDVMAVGRMAV